MLTIWSRVGASSSGRSRRTILYPAGRVAATRRSRPSGNPRDSRSVSRSRGASSARADLPSGRQQTPDRPKERRSQRARSSATSGRATTGSISPATPSARPRRATRRTRRRRRPGEPLSRLQRRDLVVETVSERQVRLRAPLQQPMPLPQRLVELAGVRRNRPRSHSQSVPPR